MITSLVFHEVMRKFPVSSVMWVNWFLFGGLLNTMSTKCFDATKYNG